MPKPLRSSIALILLILLVFSLAVTPALSLPVFVGSGGPLAEAKALINSYFLYDIPKDLDAPTVKELVEKLDDPYSQYLDPAAFKQFQGSLEGSFGGVGIQIERVGDYIVIVSPLKGTPGERAGLKPGDRILQAAGQSLVGGTTEQAVSLIRGEPGTPVVLLIQRGEGEPFEVTLVREMINLYGVKWEMLEGQIGYIEVPTFGQKTAAEVQRALETLQKRGAKGIILDLRNNPGGYLDVTVDITGLFIPGGPVVNVLSKNGGESLTATGRSTVLPLAVLVNEGSASASEILAGAVQDYKSGSLVGTTTFGKGTVQTLFQLGDGGVLKLTTAKYLTPNGRKIEGQGLSPDYVVYGSDLQLHYALRLLGGGKARTISLLIGNTKARVSGAEFHLDVAPFIENNRTYVPLRFVSENMGALVTWEHEQKVASIKLGANTIELRPGELTAMVNGRPKSFDVPTILKEDRVFVPVRFVSENLGAKVDWLDGLNVVQVTH